MLTRSEVGALQSTDTSFAAILENLRQAASILNTFNAIALVDMGP